MAAKGAAFGIRHLLKKVDENFTYAAVQRAKTLLGQTRGQVRRRNSQPNGREWPQAKNNSS